ncbi:hypothetical protein SAMN05216388_103319 [Halorientalis persicus]|uniref:Dolichyl-phosphate-mannose-protein mannosyltransferase n=1 Tax=Halorientalis persicus TaxID=1367881 RepID=A0A1H8V5D4_9EURY|nr:hypothetical protein [Halorientalis persicus]SEP10447.1 hypothetical protein SAMN05216388_103319 [Halorientalis persicus]
MKTGLRKYSTTALKDYKILSIIAIILGIVGTSLNIVVTNPYIVTFPPALLISGLISYTTEYRANQPTLSPDLGIKPLLSLHLFISALIIVLFSLTKTRGEIVLLLSAVLVGLTALSIVKTDNLYFQLALILLTGLVIRATILFSSPVPLGNDTLFHQRMAGEIAQAGDLVPLIEENSKHFDIPLYHVFVSSVVILVDLDPQLSSFIGITIPSLVVPALVVTWIVNRHFDSTAAAISAFLVVTTDSVIRWSITPSTTTYGFILGVLILMTVILQREHRIRYIFAFLIIALTFSHQTTSVITLSIVILYAIGKVLSEDEIHITTPILFGLLVIGSFLFARINGPGGDLTVLGKLALVIGSSIQLLSVDTGASFQIPPMVNAQPGGTASLSSIQVLGPALLFLFGTIGSLTVLRSDSISDHAWNQIYKLLLVAAGLFIPIFIGPLVGFTLLLPYRWFPFAYFVLAIPASLGLIVISKKIPSISSGYLILALLLVSGLVMGGNYFGSYEDPVFDEDPGAIRYEYTEQEVSMFYHAARYSTGPVRGDTVATIVVNRHFDTKTARGLHYNYDKRGYSGVPRETLVIDRPYAHTNHAWYWLTYRGKTGSVIGELPRNALSCAEDIVYDSGGERYNGHLLRYTRTSCY